MTGSRVSRNPLDVAAPLSTLDATDIIFSGTQDLGQLLTELPSISPLGGRQANQNGDGSEGISSVDLRGLGASRTLTLVNGKRHVAASQNSAAVDLSTIPTALIKRVEVITGGASAVYGSDAVSGVVNIILDDEFEGLQLDANWARPFEGSPGANYAFSAVGGSSFADGKGHFTVSAQYDSSKLLRHADQPFSNNLTTLITDGTPGNGIPDQELLPRPTDLLNREGVALLPTGRSSFSPDGSSLIAFPDRTGVPSDFVGAAFEVPCERCFSFDDFITVQPDVERSVLSASGKYELTNNIEAYGELKYVNVQSQDADEPRQAIFFGNPINVAENAFLNEDIRTQLLNDGVNSFAFLKSFDELGTASEIQDRETFRVVGGLRGVFDAGFGAIDYDAYYIYGETNISTVQQNMRIDGNLNAAADAVDDGNGNIVCRGTLPGEDNPSTLNPAACVPINLFGFGSASQDALDFAFTDLFFDQKVQQEVIGLTFASDTSEFLTLPGGAVSYAGGFEYREEKASSTADPLSQQGIVRFAQATEDTEGGYDVYEIFGEVSIPVLSDLPFAQSLIIDGAVRYADYSHAGGATAWKVGSVWQVVDDVRFRGTYSKAVRAPNLTEAFSPQQGTSFFSIIDPCDADELAIDPPGSPVASNCAALGVPADHQNFDGLTINGVTGGNPNLESEKSTSWTVGVVLTPSFVPGMTLSVDYYSIDITDAIRFLSSADILRTCLENPGGPDANACSLITRDETSQITSLASTFVNAAALETSGVDVNMQYNVGPEVTNGFLDDSFFINVVYTYLRKNRSFDFQSDPTVFDERAGELARPTHRIRSTVGFSVNPVDVRLETRFVGNQSLIDAPFELDDARSPDETGSKLYNDIAVSANLDVFNGTTVRVFAGINNIFDVEPPALSAIGQLSSGGLYDQVGRTVVLGGSVRF